MRKATRAGRGRRGVFGNSGSPREGIQEELSSVSIEYAINFLSDTTRCVAARAYAKCRLSQHIASNTVLLIYQPACTHPLTHPLTHPHARARAHTNARTRAHTRTHARTHTHTRTRTHTHTNTHTKETIARKGRNVQIKRQDTQTFREEEKTKQRHERDGDRKHENPVYEGRRVSSDSCPSQCSSLQSFRCSLAVWQQNMLYIIRRGRCCRVCLGRYTGWRRKNQKKQCVTLSSFLALHCYPFFVSFLSFFCFFLIPSFVSFLSFFCFFLIPLLFLSYPSFVSFLSLFCFFLVPVLFLSYPFLFLSYPCFVFILFLVLSYPCFVSFLSFFVSFLSFFLFISHPCFVSFLSLFVSFLSLSSFFLIPF